MELAPDRTQ